MFVIFLGSFFYWDFILSQFLCILCKCRSLMEFSSRLTRQLWTCFDLLSHMWLMGKYIDNLFHSWFETANKCFGFLKCFGTLFFFRYPNLKSVKELIYKRGYGKVDKQRIALTENSVVEKVVDYPVYSIKCLFISTCHSQSFCILFAHDSILLLGSWQTWDHLCWRSCSWDHDCWTSFQGS